jgi:hypothetical protein
MLKPADKKAPRFRVSIKAILNQKTYNAFKKEYPEHKNITYKEFKNIIVNFNKTIIKTTLTNRDGVKLPENLGYLFIAACDKPKKGNLVNWSVLNEHSKVVKYSNWESDGLLAKIVYTNYPMSNTFPDRNLWSFIPSRNYKTEVSKDFSENYDKYIRLDNKTNVAKLFFNKPKKKYNI